MERAFFLRKQVTGRPLGAGKAGSPRWQYA